MSNVLREPAASGFDLRFIEADAATQPAASESVDLAVCLGASWIWGGYRGTLVELRRITRPGGLIVVGEPYWIHESDPAYLAYAATHPLCFFVRPDRSALRDRSAQISGRRRAHAAT